MERLYTYKDYLYKKYNNKTYKLPIQIPVTCPNRDGKIGTKGCYFCSEKGTGFESLNQMVSITEQLTKSKEKIVKRYKATKFIGYFQNYTNTYLPLVQFMEYLNEAALFDLVGIDIATRPDSLPIDYLEAIQAFGTIHHLDITFEIGLQIANDTILSKINRGHNVDDFVTCVQQIKSYGFDVCVHLILNLPDSTMEDVLTTVRLLNQLDVNIVKLHSLYIPKDSVYGDLYEKGQLYIDTLEDYVSRVITFITHLSPDIAISRMVSRIPEEDGVFCNWGVSWWKIHDAIMSTLETESLHQGMYFTK